MLTPEYSDNSLVNVDVTESPDITSEELDAMLLQTTNTAYSRARKADYNLLNQDEMRFDDLVNSTTTWVDAINAIKAAHPKP
jgi:CBS-domain-containing membrane protein